MRVYQLAVKPAHAAQMQLVSTLRCLRGRGIHGDTNAVESSARQVLIGSKQVYRDLELPTGALRENILIDGELSEWKSGQLVRLGTTVLRLTFPCEVCKKVNAVRPTLAKELLGRRGMLARVVKSGRIERGSRVEVLPETLPSIPTQPRARIYDLLSTIPLGRVVACMSALAVLGLVRGYARVVPRVLKDAPANTPVHRMVATDRSLMERHLPQQRFLLLSEGVKFEGVRVSEQSVWDAVRYFGSEE